MSHNITQVIERAAKEYMLANLPPWLTFDHVYRGIENPEDESLFNRPFTIRRYPCVVFLSDRAEAVLPNWPGTWTVAMVVEVWSSRYKGTGDDHDQRSRNIFDLFCIGTLKCAKAMSTAFNKATGEELYLRAVIPHEISIRGEGKGWCTQLTFQLEQVSHT